MRIFWVGCVLVAASCALAQTPAAKARDLFFQADDAADAAKAPASKTGEPAPKVHRLGVRYNLLQVAPATREAHAVDPDGNFSRGDCFAVEFSPNRDGHLYVFNRGSSGNLQLLLPSKGMPEEASLVKAGKTLRIPQEYCFQLNDPPGVETLVVAVIESQEDLARLQEALRSPDDAAAMKRAGGEIEQWQQQQKLAGRDLVFEKAENPESANEPAHAVYVVRTTSGESTRIVVEVRIRHE